ncbi:hypothetical protein [Sporosarcina sp. 6E9]|uniref:hypothetical protein n=1 Tax=Sporosarcina sp. 6E9 TaxID=2819235 RepID=UPI001B313D4B|nr:hypothetical protein [Sporosarcina sp. 6E9]
MKRFISLTALLLFISLFLYHGTSFSNAEIKNDAILSIVSEENALIAITYGEGGNFFVTNNTAKAIDVRNIEVVNENDQAVISVVKNDPTTIVPGKSQNFILAGDPNSLTGKVIQFTARWNGGNATINTTIPELIGLSSVEESNEANTNPEPSEDDGDNHNTEIDEDVVIEVDTDAEETVDQK